MNDKIKTVYFGLFENTSKLEIIQHKSKDIAFYVKEDFIHVKEIRGNQLISLGYQPLYQENIEEIKPFIINEKLIIFILTSERSYDNSYYNNYLFCYQLINGEYVNISNNKKLHYRSKNSKKFDISIYNNQLYLARPKYNTNGKNPNDISLVSKLNIINDFYEYDMSENLNYSKDILNADGFNFMKFNNKLYLFWNENSRGKYRVYDGYSWFASSNLTPDGVYDTQFQITDVLVFNNQIYLSWIYDDGDKEHFRIRKMDKNEYWTNADSGGIFSYDFLVNSKLVIIDNELNILYSYKNGVFLKKLINGEWVFSDSEKKNYLLTTPENYNVQGMTSSKATNGIYVFYKLYGGYNASENGFHLLKAEKIISKFLVKDLAELKTFDSINKKWITINFNNRDTKNKSISSLDNLIQNTTKSIKSNTKTNLNSGSQFSQPVNLKSFKTISNILI